jgi:hypothetical protein
MSKTSKYLFKIKTFTEIKIANQALSNSQGTQINFKATLKFSNLFRNTKEGYIVWSLVLTKLVLLIVLETVPSTTAT